MKNISLLLVSALVIIHIATDHQTALSMGISTENQGIITRAAYSLFHANWVHLLINCYCLLSLVFLCGVKKWEFVVAYTVAMTIPNIIIYDTPTIGISALNYGLTGLIMTRANKWWLMAAVNMLIIAAQSTIPGVAFYAHLYAFVLCVLIGLISNARFEE